MFHCGCWNILKGPWVRQDHDVVLHVFTYISIYIFIDLLASLSLSLSLGSLNEVRSEEKKNLGLSNTWWAEASDVHWARSSKSWRVIIENDSQEQQNNGWNSSQLFLKQHCVRRRLIWHWLTGLSPFSSRDTLFPRKITCWMTFAHKVLWWPYKESYSNMDSNIRSNTLHWLFLCQWRQMLTTTFGELLFGRGGNRTACYSDWLVDYSHHH